MSTLVPNPIIETFAASIVAAAQKLGVRFEIEDDALHVLVPPDMPVATQHRIAAPIGSNPLLHDALNGEPKAVRWLLDKERVQ